MPILIKCSCGANFYDTALRKTSYRCPSCGTHKDKRKWKFFTEKDQERMGVDNIINARVGDRKPCQK